jgi:hypothetical protein
MTDAVLTSPRYSTDENLVSAVFSSDPGAAVVRKFSPPPRGDDPRWKQIYEGLRILAAVAAEDSDYAKHRNGRGFSKSDSPKGHVLAHLRPGAVIANPSTFAEVMRMATRYRRQASRIIDGNL